jgi:hypothetical protein
MLDLEKNYFFDTNGYGPEVCDARSTKVSAPSADEFYLLCVLLAINRNYSRRGTDDDLLVKTGNLRALSTRPTWQHRGQRGSQREAEQIASRNFICPMVHLFFRTDHLVIRPVVINRFGPAMSTSRKAAEVI